MTESDENDGWIYKGKNSTYKIEKNGKVSTTTVYPLAKDLLKLKLSAEADKDKSPFVMYKYKEGEEEKEIRCKVLYDSDSEYGLQLISENPVATIQLDGNNFNDLIGILNQNAGEYLNGSNSAEHARSVGSNPNSIETDIGNTDRIYADGFQEGNGVYCTLDEEYIKDVNQMKALGIYYASNPYWLASRHYYVQGSYRLSIRYGYAQNENPGSEELVRMYPTNNYSGEYNKHYIREKWLRIVLILNEKAKITGGTGTENDPYILKN